jgi:hypothetical protein
MDVSLDINDVDNITHDDALYEFTKTKLMMDKNRQYFTRRCHLRIYQGRVADGRHAVFSQETRKKRTVNRGHSTVHFSVSLEKSCLYEDLPLMITDNWSVSTIGSNSLVHQRQTCASGHYLAFIKKNSECFKCNGSEVTRVDESIVAGNNSLTCDAYHENLSMPRIIGNLYVRGIIGFKGTAGRHLARQWSNVRISRI